VQDLIVTIEARTVLYSRLVEVLGDVPANTLMSYLPGGEPATKTDLTEVDQRLTFRLDKLEQRMDKLEQRMDKLEQRMDKLEFRMDHLEKRMDRLEQSMENLASTFHSALRSQTRIFVLTSLGSTATLAGALIGAAAVLL